MSATLRIHLVFEDRVGVVADISAKLARTGLNIVSMEVERKDRQAHVFMETEVGGGEAAREGITADLRGIPDLRSMRFIHMLPGEKRENTFRVVLDNASDGILSIDEEHKVTTINQVAKRILGCEDRHVEGSRVEDLGLPDVAILDCLQGKSFTNEKRSLITGKGRCEFFATGKSIADSHGRIVGAVEIMKDMVEIRELAQAVSRPDRITFSDFIGRSPAVKEALGFAQKIAKTDSVISVRGESGTGKELLARAIHAESGREGPFVPINCAALPETLLESELFGYTGGAFTGARRQGKPGLFELARGGTLFLDEIADLPPGPQAKILRVIQEKHVRRIGGRDEIAIDVRIITATNRNLEQMVEEGSFRKDLYYRINVLPIHIPPLKERDGDIPILSEHFLFQLNARLGKTPQFLEPGAVQKLRRHQWPGNVRELRNVIERAAILSEGERIDQAGVLFSFEMGRGVADRSGGVEDPLEERSLQNRLGRYERQIVTEAMARFSSVRAAAQWLGISHTTLLNKLKKHRVVLERK